MPLHWHRDWDLDWHHHHLHQDYHYRPFWLRSWPWYSSSYLKCPSWRRRSDEVITHVDDWLTDFDVCTRDWAAPAPVEAAAVKTTTTTTTAATKNAANKNVSDEAPWCHHSCLTGSVGIECGDEVNSHGKGTYKILIDVHHFHANELRVRVKNSDTITIEGKHQAERANKGGICITRQFTRRHRLPRYYDATQAKATISSDGILMVWVPPPPPLDDVEREVEIVATGTYYGNTDAEAPPPAPPPPPPGNASSSNMRAIENEGNNGADAEDDDGAAGKTKKNAV